MEYDYSALEALFAPPLGRHGTHMAICGMTADIDTLERAMAAFTGQERLSRAAAGWPRGVLMLDASSPLPAASAVPSLVSLAHDGVDAWKERTALMHAKVALMAFADEPFDVPTSFRLLVSTGNWTRDSWAAQSLIDMYWCCEWQCGEGGPQAHADVNAAYMFLGRLMRGLYGNSVRAFDGALSWWGKWRGLLNEVSAEKAAPRFIHSLDASLYEQIAPGFQEAKFHTVIAGSGFFEQARPGADAVPAVLDALAAMTPSAKGRHLVFNPSQAGALAPWIRAASGSAARNKLGTGRRGQWSLHLPSDPLGKPRLPGRTHLHAKFIAGVARFNRTGRDTLGALYLGSGNLSQRGLMSHARMDAEGKGKIGNIEAGIFTADRLDLDSSWQALACGKLLGEEHLPALETGDGEPLHSPLAPPPVLLARHEAAQLIFVRSDGAGPFQFRLPGELAWQDVTERQEAFGYAGPTPPFVAVRRQADDVEIFEVPVASANGVLCRQLPPQLGADDVLDGLMAFPDAPGYANDTVDDGAGIPVAPLSAAVPARLNYPLRWLATVIEAIAQRQCDLTPEQFPVWMSQVRTLLLDQLAPEYMEQIQALRLSLFSALMEDGFKPDWLVPEHTLYADYLDLISTLQVRWSLPTAEADDASAQAASIH